MFSFYNLLDQNLKQKFLILVFLYFLAYAFELISISLIFPLLRFYQITLFLIFFMIFYYF